MKIPIVVYTTPACVQCGATTRRMDTLGITYDKVDLTQHPGLAEKIDSLARFLASDEAKA